jgi:hypothetical protein
MRLSSPVLISLLALLYVVSPSPHSTALAQRIPTARLNTTATIKGTARNVLQVVTESGETWLISVPRRPEQVLYQGTASPEWLRPGMIVRFEATLKLDRKRSQAVDKLKKLTVVTLRPGVELNVYPEAVPAEEAATDDGTKSRAKITKKRRVRRGPITASCLVVGRLLEIKGNRIEVAAGRMPVRADVTEDLQVSVEVNDYRLSQPGDKVELSARYHPNAKGRAEGERLTITAAKPLAVARQAQRRRTEREQRAGGVERNEKR